MGLTPVPIGGTLTVEVEAVKVVRRVDHSPVAQEVTGKIAFPSGYSARIAQFIRQQRRP